MEKDKAGPGGAAKNNENWEDDDAAELKEGEADSVLQYLADCLRATQAQAKHTKQIYLEAMYLDLTTAYRYTNYDTYAAGISETTPEYFMAQDLAKWTN